MGRTHFFWWNRILADCHSWTGPFCPPGRCRPLLGLGGLALAYTASPRHHMGIVKQLCPEAAGTWGRRERRRKRKKLTLQAPVLRPLTALAC